MSCGPIFPPLQQISMYTDRVLRNCIWGSLSLLYKNSTVIGWRISDLPFPTILIGNKPTLSHVKEISRFGVKTVQYNEHRLKSYFVGLFSSKIRENERLGYGATFLMSTLFSIFLHFYCRPIFTSFNFTVEKLCMACIHRTQSRYVEWVLIIFALGYFKHILLFLKSRFLSEIVWRGIFLFLNQTDNTAFEPIRSAAGHAGGGGKGALKSYVNQMITGAHSVAKLLKIIWNRN